MYCFVILLLFNEMQMSVRRFSAIPHLRAQDATHVGELEVNILCLMSVVSLDKLISIPVTTCFSMF